MREITIDNEKVYLKKDWTGWRVVEPVVLKGEDGKIDWSTWNWKNFLSKKGFVTLGILLIIIMTLFLAFHEQLANYKEVTSNPCAFCEAYRNKTIQEPILKSMERGLVNISWDK